jgi:hypothetical protein
MLDGKSCKKRTFAAQQYRVFSDLAPARINAPRYRSTSNRVHGHEGLSRM